MITTRTNTSLNVIMHIIILFTFLAGLFFIYISKVEANALKNEFGDIVEKIVTKILERYPIVTAENKEEIIKLVDFAIPFYTQPSKATVERNIMVKFLSVFTILLFVSIFLSIYLTIRFECGKDVGLLRIAVENIVIFVLVGIVEFVFFTKVAMKYIPTSPSLISQTIINTIKENLDA